MDKYYTPKSEEFNTSFLWQLKDNEKWINLAGYPKNLIKLLYNNEIRVKYLDKEDIESLGFIPSNVIDVLKEEAEFIKGFEKDTYILYIQEDKKLVIYNQKEYDISNKITGNWTEEILFKGLIKNKSELIKLLKQLNIG